MICIEKQHFHINRILLLIVGLWPKQRSKFVHFQAILLIGILISSIIFQIIILISIECRTDIIINILCTMLYSVTLTIVYNSFWIKIHSLRYLLEQLDSIYSELKDKNEITIIKKYGKKAKRHTVMLLSITLCGLFIFVSLTIWPRIDTDILLLINESQCCIKHAFIIEYFLNKESYFHLNLLPTFATFFIGGFTMVAIGTLVMSYVKHICGIFRIASYRIEHAMMINMFENSLRKKIDIDKGIIYAIDIHCQAIKFSKFIAYNFEGTFLVLIFSGVTCLSLNLFGMFRCVLIGDNARKFFIHSTVVFLITLYMFLINYAGQEIINHNNDIFSAAYNVQWYVAPLRTQKLILLLLQRGNVAFKLSIAGVFSGSLECFATLTKQSISYFTVIYSTQK